MDPPDFLGMGPPDFLGMDPPNFLGMGPPAEPLFEPDGARFCTPPRLQDRNGGVKRRCIFGGSP